MAVASSPGAASGPRGTVAISLNEAALDSPSFRASAQHMADQVDVIERWLEKQVKANLKLATDFLAMEDSINNYLLRMIPPPGAADSVIDHDYTYLAIKRNGEAAREWWNGMTTVMRRMEATAIEPVRTFLNVDLRAFKEARRMLESSQKTYDQSLARYVGQSKTKEPSALREDVFALFESRKAYLKSSLEYCRLAPQLCFNLDKVLIRISSGVWDEMRWARDQPASLARWTAEMERIKGWSKEMAASEAVFRQEILRLRRDINDSTLQAVTPSRELDEYSVSTVPFLGGPGNVRRRNKDAECAASEKQGWLFLRQVSASKPVRTSWTRRWYYCRDGVFGWLVQGPLGVLQGDEIGVLLCNAKPAVNEDRRFCFEVKTGVQSMMLQAETQVELMAWIDVFDVSRQLAFETSGVRAAKSPGEADPAFAITPPSMPEFSARMLDAHFNTVEDVVTAAVAFERGMTLTVPVSDATRASLDFGAGGGGGGGRRTLAAIGRELALAREDGQSSREHASRIIQNLNLHRNRGAPATTQDGLGSAGGGSGALAGFGTSSSHNLLPTHPSPAAAATSSPMRLGFPIIPAVDAPRDSLAPNTLAKPPVSTLLSRTAVIATAGRGLCKDNAHSMPDSVMANYWGSKLWGGLHSPSKPPPTPRQDEDPIGVVVGDDGRKTPVEDSFRGHHGAEKFPPDYPQELKAQHAQFRILFPKVPIDEKLVLVFRAAWSASVIGWPSMRPQGSEAGEGGLQLAPEQEAGTSVTGRVYVTSDHMYFYGYHMGLVSTGGVSLDSITEVTTRSGADCDLIQLHLQHEDNNHTRGSLLNIHTFLDDFDLLINRLNLLIDDLQSEEPMDLGDLIAALTSIERDESGRRTPSATSWMESGLNTPFEGSGGGGGGSHAATPRLTLAPDFGNRDRIRLRQKAKFALPQGPVMYEPENMGAAVAERYFEISAKACFHVLFGDQSFVFPKLYFERHAQQITQGPWRKLENGQMRREFRFAMDVAGKFKRLSTAQVTDHQTIEVFSDHVTYVVEYSRTAWHLPHSRLLRLVSKIVITHMAKSKCKLAIYVDVHWEKEPKFSKWLVEKQALDDARTGAEELAEVATDQVRKLGPHSRTKRAIQVYGHVGQQDQAIQFSPAEPRAGGGSGKQQPVVMRTLTTMAIDTLLSFAESVITSVMMWAFAGVAKCFKVLTAHRLLLLGLLASVLVNVVVTSKDGWDWWRERRAARFMNKLGVGPNALMSRAIYLHDLDAVTGLDLRQPFVSSRDGNDNKSECFLMYQAVVNATDIDAPAEHAGTALALSSTASRLTAARLQRTRQRMGIYRHDLMVAMKVVNQIERDVVRAEWENWLEDENVRCERLRIKLEDAWRADERQSIRQADEQAEKDFIQSSRHNDDDKRQDWTQVEGLKEWYEDYCGSCRAEIRGLAASCDEAGRWI